MPIPNRREYEKLRVLPEAKEQILKAYEVWSWKRSISFAWIGFNPAIQMPVLTKYTVHGKDVLCGCQAKGEAVLVRLASTGVNSTCQACRVTSGPLPVSLFRVDSERIVSLTEAEEVCRKSGQRLPKVIQDQLDGRRGVFQIW